MLQSIASSPENLPRQIAIEMHTRDSVGAVAPENTAQMALLFYHMANLGYGENWCACVPLTPIVTLFVLRS